LKVNIKALKYPNILHYEWEGGIIHLTDDYVLVRCQPGRKLIHHTKNKVFTIDNTYLEYFSLKEWFTAAMEIENGKVVSFYCNVAMPSILKNNELSFIDLDLDLIKEKEQDWKVVDVDEFEFNSIKYEYPLDLKEEAVEALGRLKGKVERGDFPFNPQILSFT
jgi:uncharacterized protein